MATPTPPYSATRDMLLGPSSNITTISCMVGDRIQLVRPTYKGVSYIAATGSDGESLDEDYYRFGFRILFPNIGKFIDDSGDEGQSHVVYLHEQSGQQIIEFVTTELGTFTFYVMIVGIPIHDHASVAMGGPAYATYFTESDQAPEEGA